LVIFRSLARPCLAGLFVVALLCVASAEEGRLPPEPIPPEAPGSDSECQAFADAYKPIIGQLQQIRLHAPMKGPQVPMGACCEEWSGPEATKAGVCQTFQSSAAADEAWHCAVLRRDQALKACRLKVAQGRDATDIALEYLGSDNDPSLSAIKSALREGANLAIAVSPAASFARDCYEAATGKRILTGESLSAGERLMAVLGVASAGALHSAGAVMSRLEALRARGKIRAFERESETLAALIKETDATINITRRESAAILNARLPSPGYGSDAFVGVAKEELRLFRVHASPNPIREGATGVFAMRVFPAPATTAALRDAFALPTAPNYLTEFVVPAGREVRISLVAKNAQLGTGGKIQYEILAGENELGSWMRSTETWLPAGQPQMH
jgi:hypothetical protein